MTRTWKRIVLAVALVGLAATLQPVMAACGSFATMTTITDAGRSYIWTEGQFDASYAYPPYVLAYTPPVSPNLDGVWWRLGAGNPTIGLGDDSGAFDFIADGAVYFYGPGAYGSYFGANIFTGWGADGSVDGCIELSDQCSCVLLSDSDGDDTKFALIAARSDANLQTFFEQPGNDGSGNFAAIILKSLPQPNVVQANRNPVTNDLDLIRVRVDPPSQGVYAKDGCQCGPSGYKVLAQILPRGSAAPSTRSLGAWSELPTVGGGAQGETNLGQTIDLESQCGASNVDIWLTAQVFFTDGFSASTVSSNSTRVECGPNYVEEPTQIDRQDRGRKNRPLTPRGSRRR
ncbi:MAG: hypothetical protein GY716_14580 [bacterium]|nr:hypothetical protein [bacterium]